MTALIVDDEVAARYAIRRILIADFGFTVIEADSALEALEHLNQKTVDVLFLDMRMPLLDGLEMLEELRRSDRFKKLPVVIMSVERDERSVRRAIELGVVDYLIKQGDRDELRLRLTTTVQSRLANCWRSSMASAGDGLQLRPGMSILAVDNNTDARHFYRNLFQAQYRFAEARSSAQALRMVVAAPPDVVVLGEDVGVMGAESFVRTVRQKSHYPDLRFIAVVPKEKLDATRHARVYDAVVAKTFVGDLFLQQLADIAPLTGPLDELRRRIPHLSAHLASAVAQVWGMVLSVEIEQRGSRAAAPGSSDGTSSTMTVPLTVESPSFDLTLAVITTPETARQIASRMIGTAADDLAPGDEDSALGEIVNLVGGRLQHAIREAGLQVRLGLPTRDALPTSCSAETGMALDFEFSQATAGRSAFTIQLHAQPR